jgi:hypothetical protein
VAGIQRAIGVIRPDNQLPQLPHKLAEFAATAGLYLDPAEVITYHGRDDVFEFLRRIESYDAVVAANLSALQNSERAVTERCELLLMAGKRRYPRRWCWGAPNRG